MCKLSHDRIKAANPEDRHIGLDHLLRRLQPDDFTKTSAYAETSARTGRSGWREGLIDINIPMNYKPETTDSMKKSFREWTDNSGKWRGRGVVYQGIDADNQSAADMLTQIEYCRKAGQTGFVLFEFNAGKHRDAIVAELGAGLGPAPKLPVNEPLERDRRRGGSMTWGSSLPSSGSCRRRGEVQEGDRARSRTTRTLILGLAAVI